MGARTSIIGVSRHNALHSNSDILVLGLAGEIVADSATLGLMPSIVEKLKAF